MKIQEREIRLAHGYLTYSNVKGGMTRFDDSLEDIPDPYDLGCDSYNYISFIEVDKEHRGKGIAGKLLRIFLRRTRKSVVVLLCSGGVWNGFVLKKTLRRLGFRFLSKYSKEYCGYYMFLSRKNLKIVLDNISKDVIVMHKH